MKEPYINLKILGREKMYCNLVHYLEERNFDSSAYVGSTFGMRGEKEIVEQAAFATSILVTFEDKKFMAPIGYDIYLKHMYGDYMKLPPEKMRGGQHEYEAYVK